MDDIKVVAPSKELLFQSLKTIARVADAIGLKLNPTKCATIHLNQGEYSIGQPMSIPNLGKTEAYNEISSKILERVRTIWNKELNVTFRQKIKLTNTCVAPIARYYGSMMIIGRGMLVANLHRFDELDAAIRMIIVSEKAKQFNTSKDRVYIHPSSMGYGLTSMKNSVEDSIMYNYMYLMLDDDLSAQRALFKEFVVRNRRNLIRDTEALLTKYGMSNLIIVSEGERSVAVDGTEYCKPTPAARHACKLMEIEPTSDLPPGAAGVDFIMRQPNILSLVAMNSAHPYSFQGIIKA
uniref:Reverse transcriptase n=1 Tax=Ditylenchus dipsaci TaxID=166011 RepID=A0A915EQL3_9BILA